ncbi:hypothetical protein D5071_16585 [Pectobacterium carotovorum]|uniref:Uncharacterized protein n=1 Tax=Pectobacterium carotovorum TaxID=554 RepID=A0A419AT55_PECCA|nr:hypothetical protein D5071_16585 [Pectobacterium carotovorum]
MGHLYCSEVSISPLFRWPNSVNHFIRLGVGPKMGMVFSYLRGEGNSLSHTDLHSSFFEKCFQANA